MPQWRQNEHTRTSYGPTPLTKRSSACTRTTQCSSWVSQSTVGSCIWTMPNYAWNSDGRIDFWPAWSKSPHSSLTAPQQTLTQTYTVHFDTWSHAIAHPQTQPNTAPTKYFTWHRNSKQGMQVMNDIVVDLFNNLLEGPHCPVWLCM